MIYLETIWDRADEKFVGNAVRSLVSPSSTSDVEITVTGFLFRSFPGPAFVGVAVPDDLGHEAVNEWLGSHFSLSSVVGSPNRQPLPTSRFPQAEPVSPCESRA